MKFLIDIYFQKLEISNINYISLRQIRFSYAKKITSIVFGLETINKVCNIRSSNLSICIIAKLLNGIISKNGIQRQNLANYPNFIPKLDINLKKFESLIQFHYVDPSSETLHELVNNIMYGLVPVTFLCEDLLQSKYEHMSFFQNLQHISTQYKLVKLVSIKSIRYH